MQYVIAALLLVAIIILIIQHTRMNRIEASVLHLTDLMNDIRTFDHVTELMVQVGKAFAGAIIDYIPPKYLGDVHAFQVTLDDRQLQIDVPEPNSYTIAWTNGLGERQSAPVEPPAYVAPEDASIRNELIKVMRRYLKSPVSIQDHI